MTASRRPAPPADVWARVARSPGLRTLRSARFRLIVAATLWTIGLVMLTGLFVRQAVDANGQFGIDFADYRTASLRLLNGETPYAAELLAGPVAAQGVDRYRYPPVFAQLITPVAVLPAGPAAVTWLALQAVMLFASAWLAARAAGMPASAEGLLWTGVAVTYFYPAFDTLWKGNVSGVLALSTALLVASRPGVAIRADRRAAIAGALGAVAAVVKVTPIAAFPALLRAGGLRAAAAVAGLAAILLASVLAVPHAWSDYTRVLPNLFAGDASYPTNLAPSIAIGNLGASGFLVDAVRGLGLVTAALLLVASVGLAGRGATWVAAIGCAAAASLLVPTVLWYHYLVVLIPIAAYGWVRAGSRRRAALLASAAVVDLGLAFLPIASLGATLFAASSVAAAWPAPERS